ncbi:MAG: TIGR03086 family metal-binding protein [Actinomycetota bacterium]
MSKQLEMYLRSVDEFDKRMVAVRPIDLDKQTPCAEWKVRDLINHLVYEDKWAGPLLEGKTVAEVGDEFEGDLVGDDPHLAWKLASAGAKAAAQEPGAMERTVHLSFGDFSGADYLDQLTADHLIHSWDLGRGISGQENLDADLMEHVHAWAVPIEDMLKGSGLYGEKIEAPEGADLQTKLLAVFGRQA